MGGNLREGQMKLSGLGERALWLLHRAAELWAPKLARVYSGVHGCGYPVVEMLEDRDRLKGNDDRPGLVAYLNPQGDLFENGPAKLSEEDGRVLWYALRNYRGHIDQLRTKEIEAGHDVSDHDRDLELIGNWNAETATVEGGLLADLYGGWEAVAEEIDPDQTEIAT